jgi:hypothetical protein
MKLGATLIILFYFSITTSFAGNFTPIPKSKIAQSGACAANCQSLFNLCLQLCGSSCLSTSTNRLPVTRNCDFERDACLRGCEGQRGG